MRTGRLPKPISRSPGGASIVWIRSWGGRARILERRGVFTLRSSNPSYCLGRRRGWQPHTLSGFGGGFHHRVAWRILGKIPQQRAEGTWEYPRLGYATRAAGLDETETYISRRQNTVAQYINTCPILDLCLYVERRPGSRTPKRWW